MTKDQFEELRSKQDLSNLFYPSAKEWMWDYCLYLGSFTDTNGDNFDLGVHYNGNKYENAEFSDATVYDDTPGAYFSGLFNNDMISAYKESNNRNGGFQSRIECINRLQNLLNSI